MITIVGCGNTNRSDDGVGVVVAQRLRSSFESLGARGVQVVDAGTGGMEVMFKARGSDLLIVVDASNSGSQAGTIFHVPGSELEASPEAAFNLHDFRWQHALFVGRKLFGEAFPDSVEVFLVEAKSLDFGIELTPEVEAAANSVVKRLLERFAAAALPGDESKGVGRIRVHSGNIYLDADLCAGYLPGIQSVAIIEDDSKIYLVPLASGGSGGYLLKVLNARGDRVVHCEEFLERFGIARDAKSSWTVHWDAGRYALVFEPQAY